MMRTAHGWRTIYAGLFSFTAAMRELNHKSYEAATDLRTLERHTMFTDVSRDRLAQDVAKLRAMYATQKLGAGQWLERAKPLGLVLEGVEADLARASTICAMPDGSGGKTGSAAS